MIDTIQEMSIGIVNLPWPEYCLEHLHKRLLASGWNGPEEEYELWQMAITYDAEGC